MYGCLCVSACRVPREMPYWLNNRPNKFQVLILFSKSFINHRQCVRFPLISHNYKRTSMENVCSFSSSIRRNGTKDLPSSSSSSPTASSIIISWSNPQQNGISPPSCLSFGFSPKKRSSDYLSRLLHNKPKALPNACVGIRKCPYKWRWLLFSSKSHVRIKFVCLFSFSFRKKSLRVNSALRITIDREIHWNYLIESKGAKLHFSNRSPTVKPATTKRSGDETMFENGS